MAGVRSFRVLLKSALLTPLLIAVPLSCGSRSELSSQSPCYTPGDNRACENDCGPGTQICEAGYWQDCIVAPTEVPCENDCGGGLAHCEDGKRGECVVTPTSKKCSNVCGEGESWCVDNVWGECVVEWKTLECANDCGTGSKVCENGIMGECVVAPVVEGCFSACGNGVMTCVDNVQTPCNAPQPLPPKLRAIVRDFRADWVDFEATGASGNIDDRGVLARQLGPDGLPVWAKPGASLTISGQAAFDTWFRDVPGLNQATAIDLQLHESSSQPGLYVYENTSFFPIDGRLLGNEGRSHNYHFTMMVATEFVYVGGETFTFEGDDDMWVFINRQLTIDLGGIHQSETASVSLDAEAGRLGIVPGGRYPLHFFFAERHTVSSNFTIRTTIADVGACP
jgi:fibro-slime domain-containing protein